MTTRQYYVCVDNFKICEIEMPADTTHYQLDKKRTDIAAERKCPPHYIQLIPKPQEAK